MEIKLKEKNVVLTNPQKTYEILKTILKAESKNDQMKEHFWVIGLNARNIIQYIELTSLGTLNTNLVHPREVFEPAVRNLVAQIVVAHNHPSGDPEPSEDDLTMTKTLEEAGKILGIEILDHIIIAENKYFSFSDNNLIKGGGQNDF